MNYLFQKQLISKLNDEQLQKALEVNKVSNEVGGPIINASEFRKRVEANLSPKCRWPMDLDELYSVGGKPQTFKGNVHD